MTSERRVGQYCTRFGAGGRLSEYRPRTGHGLVNFRRRSFEERGACRSRSWTCFCATKEVSELQVKPLAGMGQGRDKPGASSHSTFGQDDRRAWLRGPIKAAPCRVAGKDGGQARQVAAWQLADILLSGARHDPTDGRLSGGVFSFAHARPCESEVISGRHDRVVNRPGLDTKRWAQRSRRWGGPALLCR